MSQELDEVRQEKIIAAALAFEADRTVAKRDALFAAVVASKAPRFYQIQDRVMFYRQGEEIGIAHCRSGAVAQAMVDRLNTDLDAGWVPSLP